MFSVPRLITLLAPDCRRSAGRFGLATATLAIAGVAGIHEPALAADTASQVRHPQSNCASVRLATEFYEAGRIASFPVTVPNSACTTISVSHIKDPAVPSDRCQTFLVGFFPADGSEATYTEPVTACSVPPSTRTVLATDVPDGVVYRILYNVDYITPDTQIVRYKVWH